MVQSSEVQLYPQLSQVQWILDSGLTDHISPSIDHFLIHSTASEPCRVTTGGGILSITGIRDVH